MDPDSEGSANSQLQIKEKRCWLTTVAFFLLATEKKNSFMENNGVDNTDLWRSSRSTAYYAVGTVARRASVVKPRYFKAILVLERCC